MKAANTAWGLLGALALAAGAIGAYFSLQSAGEGRSVPAAAPSPPRAFVFRTHESPRPVPEIAFQDAQGGRRTLAEFAGKAVLLNIWATWCAPCREEMPALDRLQQKLGGPDFEVIALSIDSGGAGAVKRFYEETGVRALTIYVDPEARVTGSLAVVGVPNDAAHRPSGTRDRPAHRARGMGRPGGDAHHRGLARAMSAAARR